MVAERTCGDGENEMRRRDFVGLVGGGALSWSLQAHAQQAGMPVIGFLSARSPVEAVAAFRAFHEGLAQNGYSEGKNVAFEYRWADGRYERLPEMAVEIAGGRGGVLFVNRGGPSPPAAKGG